MECCTEPIWKNPMNKTNHPMNKGRTWTHGSLIRSLIFGTLNGLKILTSPSRRTFWKINMEMEPNKAHTHESFYGSIIIEGGPIIVFCTLNYLQNNIFFGQQFFLISHQSMTSNILITYMLSYVNYFYSVPTMFVFLLAPPSKGWSSKLLTIDQ